MASAIARESLPELKKCKTNKKLSEVIIIIWQGHHILYDQTHSPQKMKPVPPHFLLTFIASSTRNGAGGEGGGWAMKSVQPLQALTWLTHLPNDFSNPVSKYYISRLLYIMNASLWEDSLTFLLIKLVSYLAKIHVSCVFLWHDLLIASLFTVYMFRNLKRPNETPNCKHFPLYCGYQQYHLVQIKQLNLSKIPKSFQYYTF